MRLTGLRFVLAISCLLALVVAACATGRTTAWEGRWWEAGDDTIYTLRLENNELRVVEAFCRQDSEDYPVRSSGWRNDTFTWTIDVPSTGYSVTYEVSSVTHNSMSVRWTNGFTSGEDILQRVDSKE
ncbi:MAG: hypothetical protein K8R90_01865 [Candidatus Cloacimonetes bacterium]|nr:hypothetical protein [Candidatus Cloacimonadota bacterium]